MSLVTVVSTRLISSLGLIVRAAVQRLGLGTIILVATAAAAFLVSLRPQPPRRPRRPAQRQSDQGPSQRSIAASTAQQKPPHWLARVRKVTIGAKCTRAEPCSLFVQRIDVDASPSTYSFVLADGVLPHLKRFAKHFDTFLIVRIDDDQTETMVTNVLKEAGLFEPGLLDPRKLLFTETDLGRVSVARQIEPQLHIDETPEVITALQRFLFCVAFVSGDVSIINTDSFASNAAKFTSLGAFFSNTS